MLGDIGNDDVLIAAVTFASLALLLPASNQNSSYFASKQGRIAFVITMTVLVATAVMTAFHTPTSFVLLMVSLGSAFILGAWTIITSSENEAGVAEALDVIRAGRPKGKLPPHGQACKATSKTTDQPCKNRGKLNGYCGLHAPIP